ncbi:MAG: hypothetical protein IPG66_06805 [Hydrogenophilales bacterium]|nr:hypothetical protein [Hydrogenophilales bacterium]
MFNTTRLQEFYDLISVESGIDTYEFFSQFDALFLAERSQQDLDDYRLGRKPWKKLRDEVSPVSRFLRYAEISSAQVRFPLNDKAPDCWLVTSDGGSYGIEVTIARGRERYHRTTEMIEKGLGRGFIGIQDDEPQESFTNRMSKPRLAYSSEQALKTTKLGILRCLSRKNDYAKYGDIFYLIIETDLNLLPHERWLPIIDELSNAAHNLPFCEIHVIGDSETTPKGFRIK